MAWDGYFEYDGTEVISAPRTETYLTGAGKQWFVPTFEKPGFAALLGQPDYLTPLLDTAPWVDPDLPESWEFFGFFPLDISGIENSARGSTPIEFTTDGGSGGRLRHGTKTLVFNGMLLADSERGAEYGMTWLRRVLLGAKCSDRLTTEHALGADLTYFAHEPDGGDDAPNELFLDGGDPLSGPHFVADPQAFEIGSAVGLRVVQRRLKGVVINNGPMVTSKRSMSCGGAVWTAQFTAVVGNPYEYGAEFPILQGYLDPAVTDPWAPGINPGTASTSPTPFADVECGEDSWEPLFDPLCPALVVPPAPPSVPLGCYVPETSWDRYEVSLPGDNVPLWSDVVPTLTVQAPAGSEVRNVRVRFYPDPEGTFDPNVSPCDHIADLVLSYIPAGGTMILDGTSKQVFVVTNLGRRRRADSLVFSSDGAPFNWPSLTCGVEHIMTIDLPTTEAVPVVDLSLTSRSR